MPELHDVEGFCAIAAKHALQQNIQQVQVEKERVLEGLSAAVLGRKLHNHTFTDAHRHGKLLFLRTGREGWLFLHFGMTGSLEMRDKQDAIPDHTCIHFQFKNGGGLCYLSQRLLGKVGWCDDLDAFLAEAEIGPDLLADDLTGDDFVRGLSEKHGMLKPALMDQSLFAGIGNVLSDEILFQTRLPPDTEIADLKENTLRDLFGPARRICRTLARAHRAQRDIPKHYLLAHRHKDGSCPRCHQKLSHKKVAGRTSYFCSSCQSA